MEEDSKGYSDRWAGKVEPRGGTPRDLVSRSRSPRRRDRYERRLRSPIRHGEDRGEPCDKGKHDEGHHRKRHHKKSHTSGPRGEPATASLPFDARPLSKADYKPFLPLLAYYLDLQKDKDLSAMDEREVRGRWKSFLRKWNGGELSRSWYDPEMFATAVERMGDVEPIGRSGRSRETETNIDERGAANWGHVKDLSEGDKASDDHDDDDDDDVGPMLPPTSRFKAQRSGPGIPNLDDLAAVREARADEARESREGAYADLRHARAQDRKLQKDRLEELVPRAEPGTRERRLEKKAAVNEKMRGFRDKSPGGDAAVGDGELMGGGDGIDELRREKAAMERRKTEREIRREEIARAKAAEREERVREWKEREEGTMKALKELAKQRFG